MSNKAVVCTQFGAPEKLEFLDQPEAKLRPNEVRIAVKAAGVNFPDTLIIQGKYQLKAEPPFVPGSEVAGEITEVGEKIRHFKKGDRVAAILPVGGYAHSAVAPGEAVIPLPKEMPFTEAAGFPLVYGTTMHALKQRGSLKAGETLLVLGAAGGVGLAAVQLGKILGARVIAAASTDAKLDLCAKQGADELINYSTSDLKDSVKKLTGGKGADVIFDPVGGDLGNQCFSCINWNGRYLVIGFAAGEIPSISLNRLLLKGASAIGVFWGSFVAREPQKNFENFQQLFEWYEEDKFKPYVSATYALQDAASALNDMLARKVTGKVVLTP